VVVLGRPYVMLPQTYGPFRRRESRVLAAFMLRRAAKVLTRDRNCVPVVQELCGRTPQFCPDVAFTLEPLRPTDRSIAPAGLDLAADQLVVGINVSGLLYMGGYNHRNMFGLRDNYQEIVDRLLETVLRSTSAKILLVPHVFGSEQEEEACSVLLKTYQGRYPNRVFSTTGSLSERELKWLIGHTDFFVGSRMHACIAALSQFVPTVGLAYSDKFFGVFQSAGVGDAIVDLRTADTATVIERTLSSLEIRHDLEVQLRSKIPAVKGAVVATFRDLLLSDPRVPGTASH